MLVDLQLPVDPKAFCLNGQTIDEALAQANGMLKAEARKHFGAGKIEVGRLADGRFYFRQVLLGTMVRVPDDLAIAAVRELAHGIVPAVRLFPAPGEEAIDGVHGVWARQSWVDNFVPRERAQHFLELAGAAG